MHLVQITLQSLFGLLLPAGGCRTCFGDIWIFAKFLISLHQVLSILLFSIWTVHIMYWNMIILNPPRYMVKPHSKYWYFCIEHWDLLLLRFSENTMLFHIEWVCRKTEGNVNRSPYRYTAVTHRACPPSSGFQWFCESAIYSFVWVTYFRNHDLRVCRKKVKILVNILHW